MTTIESDEDAYDDWSTLAPSYQDVFLPRFQPMYDTIAHYVVKKIQSKDTNDEYKVLDYGTGTFWRMDTWFTDSSLYLKAEKETMRILRQDFHLELKSNESFELPSKAIVVVACK
ncbi:unnamed protein product [Rotaria sp. Silwood2]|nr:unnamed protein product [Rotaria sp. Silwood2]CAF3930824.1 unnamed protein product [Rotaria sp. Silwood2]